MDDTTTVDPAIAKMPRGGPDASWLDRRLETDALEYTDRYDIPDEVKQTVISFLDETGTRNGQHEKFARTALGLVADSANPRILELGAGHGKLSAHILDLHPTATVTVSDLDPTSVANIADGTLGANPRAHTQVIDAIAIDATDGSYDLVVFASAFHHLPPATAGRAIAEATRVGKRFVVMDIPRPSPLVMIGMAVLAAPAAAVLAVVRPTFRRVIHDGAISVLRSYSRSAFIALGKTADPAMSIEFLPSPIVSGPKSAVVLFSRPAPTDS
ncbi:class I SAM-dependent methyltransferase [Nocardia sp. NPDC052112]|uniref:class I SAM-dependent methyltransferase n=1 Tax=Nocardia sp. NPDC052112 TaxID=3155646 RepID=UPI00341ED7D8